MLFAKCKAIHSAVCLATHQSEAQQKPPVGTMVTVMQIGSNLIRL